MKARGGKNRGVHVTARAAGTEGRRRWSDRLRGASEGERAADRTLNRGRAVAASNSTAPALVAMTTGITVAGFPGPATTAGAMATAAAAVFVRIVVPIALTNSVRASLARSSGGPRIVEGSAVERGVGGLVGERRGSEGAEQVRGANRRGGRESTCSDSSGFVMGPGAGNNGTQSGGSRPERRSMSRRRERRVRMEQGRNGSKDPRRRRGRGRGREGRKSGKAR